jgi:hypothetical protein
MQIQQRVNQTFQYAGSSVDCFAGGWCGEL